MSDLTCFKAYDIRGEIGVNIDEGIAYRIGRAVAQHFGAKSVVIGFDARETSPAFAAAAARGAMDAGADVLDIGMAGTEEMYWAVTEFGACAGIEVTASHNPINYNGMKIVKIWVAATGRRGGFSDDQGAGSIARLGQPRARGRNARSWRMPRVKNTWTASWGSSMWRRWRP